MSSSAPTAGSAYFTYDTGKEAGGYSATLTLSTPKDGYYLDVTKGGKDYPTPLDFKKGKVKSIRFAPHMGKEKNYSTWEYFNNGQWQVDRFTKLG